MSKPTWGVGRGTWVRALACVLAVAACVAVASVPPIVLADGQAARPSRIISLIPAVTEMLFAMGAGGQVVGVSSFDAYPPEAATRPRVGALLNPDFERILSLKPDLVVVYVSQTDLVARLSRVGVPTFIYRHSGLADIGTTISSLGERVGRGSEAGRLVRDMQADLDRVRRSVVGRSRPRVALVFGRDAGTLRGIFVSGGTGFLNDLVETAGGQNAFADVARESLQVSSEIMLSHKPDVIIETHPSSWDTTATDRERAVWRALPSLPAVRANRIHLIADDRLFIPGPRVVDAARILAGLIHPGVVAKTR